MKKLFSLFMLICFASAMTFGQVASKVHTSNVVTQGEFISFNLAKTDTLKSNDTLSYVFPVRHTNSVNIIVDMRNKLVANDTSIAVTFYSSMDGITYVPVNYGAVGTSTAYSKAIAKSAATYVEWNGASDAAWFEGRYIKVMFISKTKTGFKKILYGTVKINIR